MLVTVVKKSTTEVATEPTLVIRTQKYAQVAYPLVEKIKGQDIEARYRTLALTFPTMIMQSGLSQAVGFLMAKGKEKHHTQLLEHLAKLLGYQKNTGDFYSEVIQSDITKYQLLTRKAIEASSWLKRYTQALLEKSKED